MSPVPADLVAVREGVKADFFARHHPHLAPAEEAWRSLVAKGRQLRRDTAFGPILQPPKIPPFLRGVWPLRVVKGLPNAFRAVYTVVHDPSDGVVVRIEWIGDHAEYDRLFGYSTS